MNTNEMNLYEIKSEMYALIDPETGEMRGFDAWEELSVARDEKVEQTGLWVKNVLATASAIDTEIKALTERRDTLRRRAEGLKEYLLVGLEGAKFETPKIRISGRRTTAVEITDEDRAIAWLMDNAEDAITYQMPKISKTAVKELKKNGAEIPGVELVERLSVIIK